MLMLKKYWKNYLIEMIENKYLNLLSNQPKPLRVGQKTHTSDYKLE